MFDSIIADKCKEMVQIYCDTYRNPDLVKFKLHGIFDKETSWRGTEASYQPGCYLIFSDSGQLLYIGKASHKSNVGRRLWKHLKNPPHWMPTEPSILIVEVDKAFEAPSLEEFLIRELHPQFNDLGNSE